MLLNRLPSAAGSTGVLCLLLCLFLSAVFLVDARADEAATDAAETATEAEAVTEEQAAPEAPSPADPVPAESAPTEDTVLVAPPPPIAPTPEPVTRETVAPYLEAPLSVTPPEDFGEFWDKALKEMDSVKPRMEWSPIPLKSTEILNWEKLTFVNVDGRTIEGFYVSPANKKDLPAILYLHGLTGMETPLTDMALRGYACLSIGWRGDRFLDSNYITRDILDPHAYVLKPAILAAVRGFQALQSRREIDARRIGMTSDSFGGGIALAAAALLGEEVRFVYAASGGAAYRFQDDGTPSDSRGEFYDIQRFIESGPNLEAVVKRNLRYYDVVSFCPRLKSPVLLHASLEEQISTPMQAFAVYRNLPADNRKILVYPRGGIGLGPIPGLKNAVEQWVNEQVTRDKAPPRSTGGGRSRTLR